MRPLKMSSADLVHRARERIKEIHSRDAIGLEADDDVVIVDLRGENDSATVSSQIRSMLPGG